jgi:hypothetical protein
MVEKESIAMEQDQEDPKIVRGRVDSLTLYEVTEHELWVLEHGSPNSTFFSFSIFLLSIAVAFLIALLTVDLDPTKKRGLYDFFLLSVIVGFVGGLVLLVVWLRTRGETASVIKTIKARCRPVDTSEQVVEATDSTTKS